MKFTYLLHSLYEHVHSIAENLASEAVLVYFFPLRRTDE